MKKTKDPGKTDPTPEKVSATLITLDKKTAGKQQNDTKKAAPKSGADNEAATYAVSYTHLDVYKRQVYG